MKRTILTLLAFALTLAFAGPAPVTAQDQALSASTVIAKMLDRNAQLNTYQARVHVDMRMTSFPFLAPKLDGTAYYKRPNKFEVSFDRVPSYAKGFQKLFDDVADPISWGQDSNIVSKGLVKLDGYPREMIELYMTKKIYSTIIDNTIAYVDPSNYELLEMDWNYRSGGKIVMRQWYRMEGGYSVVSQQHVEIHIPHINAVGDSQFATYQTNVAIDDSVFKK
jgi:hypothetical protein